MGSPASSIPAPRAAAASQTRMEYLCTSAPNAGDGAHTAMASTFGQVGLVAGTAQRIGQMAPRDEAAAHFLDIETRRSQPMTREPSKAKLANLAKCYEPTRQEGAAVKAFLARLKEKPPGPRMKVSAKGGVAKVAPDHPDPAVGYMLLMGALGTVDPDFIDGLLGQLANAGTQGRTVDGRGLNFMLAMVKGVEPKDQVEAMFAAQMAAVHNATMTFARRLNHVDNIPQQDSAERAFNKLARTFAAQVEALKRYRSGGEQIVRVEHVTVNEGGQAIVGNVSHGGRGSPEKVETSS
jgi:hypothetical protein